MRTPAKTGSILAAALALPGIVPSAHAQVTVPNSTLIQFKYLYYKDYQASGGVNNNGERMTVNSPALYLLAPISDSWVFEIGAVYDDVSGASPYYHTVLSGASGQGIQDGRTQGDITVTKYFGRTAVSVRAAYSTEDDYKSLSGGLTLRHATPDQNTTFHDRRRIRGRRSVSKRRACLHAHEVDARWHRWRLAGTKPKRHWADQLLLRAATRLSDRSVQGFVWSRPAARQT